MKTSIIPLISIGLNLGSALCYAANKDLRHTIYWIAAAVLTSCVTFDRW